MERDLTSLEKQVQENLVAILKDTLEDNKKIIKRLQSTIVLLVILMVGGFVYYEWSFKAFMSQYDYENTVTTTTTSNTDTNNYDSNGNSTSNVNVNIPENKVLKK